MVAANQTYLMLNWFWQHRWPLRIILISNLILFLAVKLIVVGPGQMTGTMQGMQVLGFYGLPWLLINIICIVALFLPGKQGAMASKTSNIATILDAILVCVGAIPTALNYYFVAIFLFHELQRGITP